MTVDLNLERLLSFACSLILLAACSSGEGVKRESSGPQLQINGVEIYNALAYSVNEVVLRVPATGDYVSCGNILPDSSCSSRFPARDYRETPVQVSWMEKGGSHQTPEFKLQAPATAADGDNAFIRVEIFASGQAGARLVIWTAENN